MRDVRGLTAPGDPMRAAGAEPWLSAGGTWGPHPAVLHLDIDAFFASVEQLRQPALRGRPVIVGSGVVASASYEARARGIRAGTPLRDVPRLCPEAVILPGHAPTYRAFAERVFDLAAECAPNLETFLDDALLDLTGTERAHGHIIRAAAELRRRIREETGLSVSLGLATNRVVARMVTRLAKPGGLAWLRPGGEATFVARRPIEELPGIGPTRAALLREMGVTRVADLRAFPPARLRELFGEVGLVLASRAWGRETRAVAAAELPRSIRRETSFDAPEADPGVLDGMLHYLSDRAAAQARRLGIEPRGLRVHARWADDRAAARQGTLGEGGAVTEVLFAAARELFAGLGRRRVGVRNLGVEIARFRPRDGRQLALFAREGGARAGRLDEVVDGLREQFGFRALVRGPSLELAARLPSDAYGFVLRTPCLTR
jgi:DNA polymerase-4